MRFTITLIAILIVGNAWSQSKSKQRATPGPTSLEPSPYLKEVYGPRIAKTKSKARKSSVETREEFEVRMKRTAKMIRKREKLLRKPQYSDPKYFGHKRIPKRHKPRKMKFCNECEIRH